MFRAHLHPTRSDLLFGFGVIALWATLWLWFFAQLSQPGPGAAPAGVESEVAMISR